MKKASESAASAAFDAVTCTCVAMKSDELYVGGSLTLSGTVHHAMPVASSYMTLGLADTRVVPVTYASVAGDFTSFATAGEFSANRTLAETRYVVVLEV